MTFNVYCYSTPIGELLLASTDKGLCLCDWRYRQRREQIDARIERLSNRKLCYPVLHIYGQNEPLPRLIAQATSQLSQYFAGQRQQFDVPLDPLGTPFQKSVWDALQNIPYGETRSYKQLAEQLQQPSAIRAVAAANGANALSIFIPCHRIIGSSGGLVGYAGGLPAKQRLLELEQPTLFDN